MRFVDLRLSLPRGGVMLGGEFVPTGVALGVSRSRLTISDNDFNHGVVGFATNIMRSTNRRCLPPSR